MVLWWIVDDDYVVCVDWWIDIGVVVDCFDIVEFGYVFGVDGVEDDDIFLVGEFWEVFGWGDYLY